MKIEDYTDLRLKLGQIFLSVFSVGCFRREMVVVVEKEIKEHRSEIAESLIYNL